MKIAGKNKKKSDEEKLPGYEPYPDSEDIFSKDEEIDIDPEKLMESKGNQVPDAASGMKKKRADSFDELDVPGSELDDELEIIGDEDEENNYYSLGGDDHNDLDEDRP